MRCFAGLVCVLALGVMPLVGCSDSEGAGGSGGEAGSGGTAGSGGMAGTGGAAGSGGTAGTGGEGGTGGTGVVCIDNVCPCTEPGIRAAIAEGGGPFTFDCNGLRTVVTEAEIVIDNDVILDGEGNLIVDGNEDHRVFAVAPDVDATLVGLAIMSGDNTDYGSSGGGIYAAGGSVLRVEDSTLAHNLFGAIVSEGSLFIENSVISENIGSAADYPFIVFAGVTGHEVFIDRSTIANNEGFGGVGIRPNCLQPDQPPVHCLLALPGTLVLTDSTVRDGIGAAVHVHESNYPGLQAPASARVSGCTIAANNGGGGYGSFYNGGDMTIANTTLSGNNNGGSEIVNAGSLTVTNSAISQDIVANTTGSVLTIRGSAVTGGCSLNSVITSNGYNIESPGDTCGFDTNKGDQVNVSAEQLNLGPLQDNGGPTMTHALGTGSVAIDQIPEADCVDADGQPLTTDQRGEPRPETGGSMCDVGAFEVQP